jgi:very-short-patch-repair endonuclease
MTQEELKLYASNQANELKSKMTKGESYLWETLKRHNRKYGTKWQCQIPIVIDLPVKQKFKTKPFYVADFIELDHKVIIEVDGPHHNLTMDKYRDEIRDEALAACGFTTYRIQALDVWRKAVLKPFLDNIYNKEALSPWYA